MPEDKKSPEDLAIEKALGEEMEAIANTILLDVCQGDVKSATFMALGAGLMLADLAGISRQVVLDIVNSYPEAGKEEIPHGR